MALSRRMVVVGFLVKNKRKFFSVAEIQEGVTKSYGTHVTKDLVRSVLKEVEVIFHLEKNQLREGKKNKPVNYYKFIN